jgi:hypothetical protein
VHSSRRSSALSALKPPLLSAGAVPYRDLPYVPYRDLPLLSVTYRHSSNTCRKAGPMGGAAAPPCHRAFLPHHINLDIGDVDD